MGRLVIFLVVMALGSAATFAKEMTFLVQVNDMRQLGFDRSQLIYAEGEISAGTTKRFMDTVGKHKLIEGATVILNSPGGLLDEGMRLG